MSKIIHTQNPGETPTSFETLSREELFELMISESQALLNELEQVTREAEQISATSMPLLAATKAEVERILGEEYFKALSELKEA